MVSYKRVNCKTVVNSLIRLIATVVCFFSNQVFNFFQSVEMRIALQLLFLATFATFGDCKKSGGNLTHKKGHKKGGTYLKTKKSGRKSKANITGHEVEPKEEGTDYSDLDSLANMDWERKEKYWMDTFEKQWKKLGSQAESEMSKPKSENRNGQGQKEDLDFLMVTVPDASSP